MNYTLCVLALVNVVGAGLSYIVHGGSIMQQLHLVVEAILH